MTTIEARGYGEKSNERCAGLLAEEDDLSERERIRVSNRELRGSPAYLRVAPGGTAVQPQLRRTAGLANNLNVAPQHSLRVAGAERFHGCLLGGEPAREMNRWIMPSHAVSDLRFREDAVSEPFAVPFDCCSDTRDIRRVQAESDDGHAPTA